MSTVIKDVPTIKVCGLGTYIHTVATAGLFKVSVSSTVVPVSTLQISIQKNSETALTSAAAGNQSILNLQTRLNCAINDTITVVLSSSAVSDNQLNTVSSLISISRIT